MCGIIGVTGVDDPLRMLLDGLTLLEYRGYDSAGVALVTSAGKGTETHSIWRERAAVRAESIPELERIAPTAPAARAGIGHTRWATHGPPTEPNAHPHLDCTGRVAIVHNGIIENHRELSAKLDASGHRRTSQTDSEVVAHLVESELRVRLRPPRGRAAVRGTAPRRFRPRGGVRRRAGDASRHAPDLAANRRSDRLGRRGRLGHRSSAQHHPGPLRLERR